MSRLSISETPKALTRMVCLANSTKVSERCIAGVIRVEGELQWVRPVGAHGSVSHTERTLDTGREPALLDIVRIGLDQPAPNRRQPENWSISADQWQYERTLSAAEARRLLDELELGDELLFGSGADRILSVDLDAHPVGYSLAAVTPGIVRWEATTNFRGNHQLRARFDFGNERYDLVVTDPTWVERSRPLGRGVYEGDDDRVNPTGDELRFVVSLADELAATGHCFKLVAGVVALP
jgi:hypothetical protein